MQTLSERTGSRRPGGLPPQTAELCSSHRPRSAPRSAGHRVRASALAQLTASRGSSKETEQEIPGNRDRARERRKQLAAICSKVCSVTLSAAACVRRQPWLWSLPTRRAAQLSAAQDMEADAAARPLSGLWGQRSFPPRVANAVLPQHLLSVKAILRTPGSSHFGTAETHLVPGFPHLSVLAVSEPSEALPGRPAHTSPQNKAVLYFSSQGQSLAIAEGV